MTEITDSAHDQSAAGSAPGGETTHTTLTRPTGNRMLAGVASGLADYTGIDVIIVRIAFLVLTLLGGAGIPVYLACWLLMPAEDSGRSIAGDFTRDLRARSQDL
jgi:phage shock protein PspC (stress-responsive transcriptional regulator)